MKISAGKDEPATGAASRFTYASGSRPLAGYTIKRGIGSGGFGEVYYAVSDAGKEVALKLIRRHLDVELRGVRQCLNLKHPNLLALHDIRTDDAEDRWVVMEYISGESLEDAIDRHPQGMPKEEVLDWMRGIAAGVAHLHEHGIVHRDLKPGNIFRDQGIVKIGDYGLSKFVSCSRRSGQTESVGTVHYMAPEIANGRYGKEIDTYALGVILYEMLTGRVPFEGESVGEILMKHLTAEPELASLEEPYRNLVARTLAKDPEQRVSSAKQLLAILPASPAAASTYEASYTSAQTAEAHSHVAAAEIVGDEVVAAQAVAQAADDEPVWRAVRESCRQLNDQWTAANFHPAIKLVVLLGGLFLALSSAGVWLPIFFLAVMAYGVYRIVRAILLPATRSDSKFCPSRPRDRHEAKTQAANTAPDGTPRNRRLRRTRSWRRDKIAELAIKSPRQRVTELLGSMLLAACVAIVMTIVMLVLRPAEVGAVQFAWMAIVSTLGAWAVMAPAKLWEGVSGEQAPRRFTMLVAGLLLGAVGFGVMNFLDADLRFGPEMATRWKIESPMRDMLPAGFFDVDGTPLLPAFLAYFGFLFLMLRWWRQADPARGTRLSLWSTACCVFAGWLLHLFWPFPQPWGFMVAGIIAISVQLASPWVSHEPKVAQS
ncbi:MAG: serine/threonine protein kinase [Planctomycetales bacterium]|nr:serine/threonine protein kinase [Planctomycetales bacterium]